MKFFKPTTLLLLTTIINLQAQHCCENTPASLMSISPMPANRFMLGYMGMYSHSSGMRHGSDSISHADVFANHHPHYEVSVKSMDMEMHMLHLMYGVTDRLGIYLMPTYMSMDMEMLKMDGMVMSHGISGWSDTTLGATFRAWSDTSTALDIGLGVGIPTGNDDRIMHGHYVHYMMQPGSGTWDIQPALQLTTRWNDFTFGARYSSVIRLEDENSAGFAFGDIHNLNAWVSYQVNDEISTSLRLGYSTQGSLKGHYNGAHHHHSPPDIQSNYGGDNLELGLGVNYIPNLPAIHGAAFGVELTLPIYQDPNGIQPDREWGFNLSASYQF